MRRTAIAALGALALGGCATDNNTLIFGTNTTVGLDVSSAATEGGSPHITIGYKRAEGVWMPLRQVPAPLANGTFDSATGLYQSDNSDTGKSSRKDAYSVFASIGAKFNGVGKTTEVDAGAGIAQFFATGAAAVNITANPALVTSLKVDSAEGTKAQADAVKTVAENQTLASVTKSMTTADIDAAEQAHRVRAAKELRIVNLAVACATTADGAYRWADIVDKTPYDDEQKAGLKQLKASELTSTLTNNPTLAKRVLAAGAQPPFNCPGA